MGKHLIGLHPACGIIGVSLKLVEDPFDRVLGAGGKVVLNSFAIKLELGIGVAAVCIAFGDGEVGGIGAPPRAVVEGGHGRGDAAEKGGREIGNVETGRSKFGEKAGTNLGKPGTEPNNVNDTRIQCPAVFACIGSVVTCRSGRGAVPCGTLLNKPQ